MATDVLYIKGNSSTLTKAAGDIVSDKLNYAELVKIPEWRVILSDSAITPFQWKGKQWKTADHAIKASSASLQEETFNTYSLDSGSDIARGSVEKTFPLPSEDILAEIWRAKFTQDEKARRVLGLTGQAQLWTIGIKGKKVRWTTLETIRNETIRNEAQRNAAVEIEMADALTKGTNTKAKTKSKKATTAATTAAATAKEDVVNVFAENTIAAPLTKEAPITPPDLNAAEETDSSLKFCPVCDNYLYIEVDTESQGLTRLCRKCGHKEEDTKGGLVMEMMIQQQSSEGYKVLLNEFTRKDPRLPHIRKNISCPNVTCDSNKGGKDPDVIYIKYDLVNLMYLYICDICGEKWHSRDRS